MSFLSSLFGTDSASFWRSRAEQFEKKYEASEKKREDERERHRIREEFLLDEILKRSGAAPIRAAAERATDAGGFEKEFFEEQKRLLKAKEAEAIQIEKDAFVQSCVRSGMPPEEAGKLFDENQTEILNS